MKRKFREVELVYYNPAVLIQTMEEAGSDLTWVEMLENIELGYAEIRSLLSLSDKADLSIKEISCLYLYYWEELSEKDIGEKLHLPRTTVEYILIRAKKKLRPELIEAINRQKCVKIEDNENDRLPFHQTTS